MSEINLGEVVCKVNLKIKGISVHPKSGAVLISAIGSTGNKDTNSSGKLFGCIARISNNSELKKLEKRGTGFKLKGDNFTLSIRPDEYFEILYLFDDVTHDLFGPIKQIVCDEVSSYFKLNQSNGQNLKNQNEMMDNSVYEGAGDACVQDSYESASILHNLSEGVPFTVEVEGHETIEIHFPEAPPKPIVIFDNKPIELNGYKVKGVDFEYHQLIVVSKDGKGKINIVLNPEDFHAFYSKYSNEFLSNSLFFNFVVQEVIGKKFNLIKFSKDGRKQSDFGF